jgi:hypothetical protein
MTVLLVSMNRHSENVSVAMSGTVKEPGVASGGEGRGRIALYGHKKPVRKTMKSLPTKTVYVTVSPHTGRFKVTRRAAQPKADVFHAVEERLRNGEQQLRRTARALAEVLERTDQGLEASPEVARSLQASENRWRAIDKEYGLLDSRSVAELLGGSGTNRNRAHQLAKEGKIIGVKRGRGTLYPGFEFDHGEVRPVIAEIAAIGRQNQWADSHLLQWLTSPNGYLEGRVPARMMDQPDKILEAALQDMAERW